MAKAWFDFTGQRVLITGGVSGIGAASARAFAAAGAKVLATGLTADEVELARRQPGFENVDCRVLDVRDHAALADPDVVADRDRPHLVARGGQVGEAAAAVPGKWICNEIDGPSRGSDEDYYRLAKESFEHGATMVSVSNWPDIDILKQRAGLFQRIARDFLAEPVPDKKPVAALTIKATESLRGTEGFQKRYNELSSNGRDWLQVLLEDDLSK